MRPPIPDFRDYDVSEQHGFLPAEFPLERLTDPYYSQWEAIVSNLQGLLLSKRLAGVVRSLPVLSTSRLVTPGEWRRAYVVLSMIVHAYIWGGDRPKERVPAPVSIPFLQVTHHLELPPVATYASTVLWNFKPLFPSEPLDLENLSTLNTFTGSLDESWFYLVSVAIEARGAHLIPLILSAMQAARTGNSAAVTSALEVMAESLDDIGSILNRMYENCDPSFFYSRIRPFVAGSRNMSVAGLANGVIFEDGSGEEAYQQWGGASNAQASLIQFFDIVLGIVHRATGTGPDSASSRANPPESAPTSPRSSPIAPPPENNFIHEMRSYMPGPHARFLRDVSAAANIRPFVASRPNDKPLTLAYDACLAMLRAMRDKHIQIVSRYIIIKSRESRNQHRSLSPTSSPPIGQQRRLNLASGTSDAATKANSQRGTGGTALIPFLKQARDETGEPAVDVWAKRLLGEKPAVGAKRKVIRGEDFGNADIDGARLGLAGMGFSDGKGGVKLGVVNEHKDGDREIVGLAGTWEVGESESVGGLCHW